MFYFIDKEFLSGILILFTWIAFMYFIVLIYNKQNKRYQQQEQLKENREQRDKRFREIQEDIQLQFNLREQSIRDFKQRDREKRKQERQERERQQREQQEHERKHTDSATEFDIRSTWHFVLGVSSNASAQEIKSAYRKRISEYHPDKVLQLGERLKEVAKIESQKINAAYEYARSQGLV